MNLRRSPPKEAQALIPDLLAEIIPVAKIAERFRGVIIENLRRMTAARWGTPTENTMALPLDHRQEDLKITDPGTELLRVIGGELLQDLGNTMTQDPGTMIPEGTPVERGVKWSIPEEDTLYIDLMITTEKAVPTPGIDRHQEGGRQPGLRPEDRHQDLDIHGRKADMEALHQGMMIG